MAHTPAVHRRIIDVALPDGTGHQLPAVKASQRAPIALYGPCNIGIMPIVGCAGNTAWNLIHFGDFEFTDLVHTAPLPIPFKGQPIPRWIKAVLAASRLDAGGSFGMLPAQESASPALAHLASDRLGFAWLPVHDSVHSLRGTPALQQDAWRMRIA